MRVLLLNWRDSHHPEAGGAEKYLVEVAEGLAARGHEVTFLTAAYPGALPDEVVRGVRYVRRGGKYTIYPQALLAQLLRRHRADVVVDVQNGIPYLTPLVRRGPVVNLVHHVHREQWPVVFSRTAAAAGWWMESRLAPVVYRRKQYVAVSGSTRRELTGLGVQDPRIEVIHNGTDAVADDTVERTAHPSIVVLGRLVPQKRIELAIEAVAVLAAELPDLELVIAGSGWWEPHLREHVERFGVADRVRFTGHVSEEEKHDLLARAWVQALPSLKEGWGLVVVEAGVHGTPTVAFAEAGGTVDSIVHGQTGLLSAEGLEPFTQQLRRLLTEEELRATLSAQVREWVARFRWSETVSAWERLLSDAVAGR